jgi:hypothetical protein
MPWKASSVMEEKARFVVKDERAAVRLSGAASARRHCFFHERIRREQTKKPRNDNKSSCGSPIFR